MLQDVNLLKCSVGICRSADEAEAVDEMAEEAVEEEFEEDFEGQLGTQVAHKVLFSEHSCESTHNM